MTDATITPGLSHIGILVPARKGVSSPGPIMHRAAQHVRTFKGAGGPAQHPGRTRKRPIDRQKI
jgi:hypothetical protein